MIVVQMPLISSFWRHPQHALIGIHHHVVARSDQIKRIPF